MSQFFRALLGQSGGGGGGGSDPSAILGSDLVAWYKIDTGIYDAIVGGSLVSSNATEIGRWEDQSGNGYHLTRSASIATGNLQWDTTVTDRGSSGTVHFMNDQTVGLSVPDAMRGVLQAAQAAEMWIRLKNASDNGGNVPWFLGGTTGSLYCYTDGSLYETAFSNTRINYGDPALDTSTAFRVYDTYCTATASRAFLDNGALLAEQSNSFDTGSTNWHLGGGTGGFPSLNAHVTEIVFAKIKGSTTQRDDMYTYMST